MFVVPNLIYLKKLVLCRTEYQQSNQSHQTANFSMVICFLFRVATAASRAESAGFEDSQSGRGDDPYAFEAGGVDQPGPSRTQLSESRLRMLSTLVSRAFQERRVEQLAIPEVRLFFLLSHHIYAFSPPTVSFGTFPPWGAECWSIVL